MSNASITPTEIERFWSRVDRGEPNTCWLWTAGTNSRGYGPIPNHQRVIPTCHNPRCCNPAHLTLVASNAPKSHSRRALAAPTTKAPPTTRGPVVSQLRAELAQLRAELAQLKAAQRASPAPTAMPPSADD